VRAEIIGIACGTIPSSLRLRSYLWRLAWPEVKMSWSQEGGLTPEDTASN